jgi:acyl-CoA thioesterase-1
MRVLNLMATMMSCAFFICLLTACKDKQANEEEVLTEKAKETSETIESTNEEIREELKTILFFGNSLTAGLGLEEEESFPSLVQSRIDSLGLDYRVINGGLSGETSAGGKGRIDWVLRQPVDIFVLELGANDMLRGLELGATKENLRDILLRVQEKYPSAKLIIAGMEAPPNMGKDYTDRFRSIFQELASEFNAGLIPFLLDGVAGRPELSIGDDKHPNAEGQQIVMENVWKILVNYL